MSVYETALNQVRETLALLRSSEPKTREKSLAITKMEEAALWLLAAKGDAKL